MADEDADDEARGGGEPWILPRPFDEPVADGEVIAGAEQGVSDGDDEDRADAQRSDHNDADSDDDHVRSRLGTYFRGRYHSHFPKKPHMMHTTTSESRVARVEIVEMQRTNQVIGQNTEA